MVLVDGFVIDSENGEAPITDLMADYLAYASNIVCVAYVNELAYPTIPTAPGAARNVITVGGLDQDLEQCLELRQLRADSRWPVQTRSARRQRHQLHRSFLGLA